MTGFVEQISVGIDPMDRCNGAIATIQMKPDRWQKQSRQQEQVIATLLSRGRRRLTRVFEHQKQKERF
jgi:hypothetical protein